jgi:hypothetical protein
MTIKETIMQRFFRPFLLALAISIAASTAIAQQGASATPAKHFKTEFVVKEVDSSGHVINSRSYSMILSTDNSKPTPNQIRSGDRVPIRVNTDKSDIAYIDIGVNIDCHNVETVGDKLAMSVKAEISSVPPGTDLNGVGSPVIRQFQWNADVLVTPSVPTTIFSSDDVGSKNKTQVEVTATPVN